MIVVRWNWSISDKKGHAWKQMVLCLLGISDSFNKVGYRTFMGLCLLSSGGDMSKQNKDKIDKALVITSF